MSTTNAPPSLAEEQTYSLEIRRLIRASRERVFQAWTDPVDLAKWHAPEGLHPEKVAANGCEGGSYAFHMRRARTPAGERYPELSIKSGSYEVDIQNELLGGIPMR